MTTEIITIIIISALIGLFTGHAIGKIREKPVTMLLMELNRTRKMLQAAIKVNHLLTDQLYLETGKQLEKLPFPEITVTSFAFDVLAKMQETAKMEKESKSEDKEEGENSNDD